jgi:hypothetical protein
VVLEVVAAVLVAVQVVMLQVVQAQVVLRVDSALVVDSAVARLLLVLLARLLLHRMRLVVLPERLRLLRRRLVPRTIRLPSLKLV